MSEEIVIALKVMGQGMFGIFVALAIVYAMIIVLTKVFPPKEGENSDKE